MSSPRKEPPSAEDIARVLNTLADEHAGEREPEMRRRAWARLSGQPRLVHRAPGSGWRTPSLLRGAALRSSTRGWWLGFAAAAAVAGLCVWLALRPEPLMYSVDGVVQSPGAVKTTDSQLLLEFSDRSWIQVARHTELDVAVVGEHSALNRLWRGKLRVSVEHQDSTNWRFLAGPYEVHVIGTRFELEWEPDAERLSLEMLEGRVRVVGPDGSGRFLDAGETLVWGSDPALPSPAVNAPAQAVQKLEQEAPSAESPRQHNRPSRVASPARASAPADDADQAVAVSPESWPELTARGQFDAVVEEARSTGVSVALSTRGAADLRALAQAARYVGENALARRTWGKIRSRFPGHSAAVQATFFLGRIEEQNGHAARARRLFDEYLTQSPRGVYASEALGRQLALAQSASGGGSAATTGIAREYLRRFPKGAYARLAADILRVGAPPRSD